MWNEAKELSNRSGLNLICSLGGTAKERNRRDKKREIERKESGVCIERRRKRRSGYMGG